MLKIYAIYLAVLFVVTFATYAVDKWKAVNGAWRIPEVALLSLTFLGGGLGGYLAMFVCRHKIRKWYFHLVHILAIAWQATALVLLLV